MSDDTPVQWKVLREPKDVFLAFSAQQYAEQLVCDSARLFRACPREAFRHAGWLPERRTEAAAPLLRYIEHFNHTSAWFAYMVVVHERVEARVAALQHIIAIAEVGFQPMQWHL